ncbi:phosphoribosyltransferase [Nitrospira sp. Kam-Ns4a]
MGYALSLALRLPLDVFIVRKLGAPGNPECAIGAVTETGSVYLHPDAPKVLRVFSAPADYLEAAIRAQRQEIARRQAVYRQGRPLPSLAGKTVLLVDDGIATGATFFGRSKPSGGLARPGCWAPSRSARPRRWRCSSQRSTGWSSSRPPPHSWPSESTIGIFARWRTN